ncbi:MAG TPA: hypothetical protein VGF50_00860 [Caulobacteraceae bacterium]|jgi:hypothetical protein
MGTTCASFHVRWARPVDDVARTVARAYAAQGYQRQRKPSADAKRVLLLARPGERFVSVFDSTNAALDNGELKEVALGASRLLKTAAVFTSLYDSDAYECILFNRGHQVDALMTEAETYQGPLKFLRGKPRATQWGKAFFRTFEPGQIDAAAAPDSAFAEASLARVAKLIDLPADRPQMYFDDLAEEDRTSVTALYFTRKAPVAGPEVSGEIALRDYFDPDNSRKLLVYPAAWPMPPEREEILTWLMLSEGGGFSGGTLEMRVSGPPGLTLSKGFLNGAKFHNGQIVGGYELAPNTDLETAKAHLETKRFALTPAGSSGADAHYTAAYPNLNVPAMTPQRTTQILLVLQLHVVAETQGEWHVAITLRPGAGDGPSYALPGLRVAAITPVWTPLVSGLNPRFGYNTDDIGEPPLPEAAADRLVQQAQANWQFRGLSQAEARAARLDQQAQMRPRSYATWRDDIPRHQPHVAQDRRLFRPSIASSVAILPDDGPGSREACRAAIEAWLRPMLGRQGELRLRADRQMTEAGSVTKLRKSWPLAEATADKAWSKLFDDAQDYQSVLISIVPEGGAIPVAGMGFAATMRPRRKDPGAAEEDAGVTSALLAMTLGKMRGRPFEPVPLGASLHLYRWVTNHAACHDFAGTSPSDMAQALDEAAAAHPPLQAWYGEGAWLPVFDRADGYEDTVYEASSVLNTFRGILHSEQLSLKALRLTAGWCSNVLRTVAPHLWLGANLAAQIDRDAVGRVAEMRGAGGSIRITKRPGASMEDLEAALLPVLPIETTRIRS